MSALIDAFAEAVHWITAEAKWRRENPCDHAHRLAEIAAEHKKRGWPRAAERKLRQAKRWRSRCKAKRLQDQRDRLRR